MFVLFLLACKPAQQRASDSPTGVTLAATGDTLWLFASDPRRDAVHASDTEASLKQRYGTANVRRQRIQLGEGETMTGTVVFPYDSLRRMQVEWADTVGFSNPTRASVSGRRSRWAAYPGVSLGSCLEEVERINRGPFSLYGFGWDYGGTSDNWKNGRLDSLWTAGSKPARVMVRFSATVNPPELRMVSGARVFPSTHPAMRASKPCIDEMFIRPR